MNRHPRGLDPDRRELPRPGEWRAYLGALWRERFGLAAEAPTATAFAKTAQGREGRAAREPVLRPEDARAPRARRGAGSARRRQFAAGSLLSESASGASHWPNRPPSKVARRAGSARGRGDRLVGDRARRRTGDRPAFGPLPAPFAVCFRPTGSLPETWGALPDRPGVPRPRRGPPLVVCLGRSVRGIAGRRHMPE